MDDGGGGKHDGVDQAFCGWGSADDTSGKQGKTQTAGQSMVATLGRGSEGGPVEGEAGPCVEGILILLLLIFPCPSSEEQ